MVEVEDSIAGQALTKRLAAGPVVQAGLMLFRARASHAGFEGGSCLVASIGLGALGNVNGGLAALSGEAKGPTGSLGAALLLAVVKGRLALGVLEAGSPLSRAFLLDALLGVSNGNSSASEDFLNGIDAVIVNNALPIVSSIGVALLGDAGVPAVNVVLAFLLAVLEGSWASGIIEAGN